ncbi:MAG: Fis family transcriptional regulator [Acidobacteria bacterium]|nr:MAG: Fis family transcriptional regulator [Acidobacteriota bacterium]PYX67314.1 MAG: Fis family transcriptional regulator [Acidobacteriota bacterium]
MKKDHTGSAFDSFLAEENLLEEAEAVALKRVIAWQLKTAMNTKHVSKTQLAQQLHTSRSQVNRLLDPAYVGVSIGRVAQAARAALGSAFASK